MDKKNNVGFKTFSAKQTDVKKDWYIVDAEGKTVGRLATEIARVIRGKHKSMFTPHVDTGDFVVVINAEHIQLTGRKRDQKIYYRHSGYPGGLKQTKARDMLNNRPERVIELAVRGMIPRHSLGRRQLRKLKVYRGAEHPHAAQQPEPLAL